MKHYLVCYAISSEVKEVLLQQQGIKIKRFWGIVGYIPEEKKPGITAASIHQMVSDTFCDSVGDHCQGYKWQHLATSNDGLHKTLYFVTDLPKEVLHSLENGCDLFTLPIHHLPGGVTDITRWMLSYAIDPSVDLTHALEFRLRAWELK